MEERELLEYVAAIIDDTSSIGINRYHPRRDPKTTYTSFIHIYKTDGKILEFINDNFYKGTAYVTLNSYNKKPLQNLRYGGKRCAELLTRVLPYLKKKREEAEWVIQFSEMIQQSCRALSAYELQERENCYLGWREAALKRRMSE